MKRFYHLIPVQNLKASSLFLENVEYDINSLIEVEAESEIDALSDSQIYDFDSQVIKMAQEIKETLHKNGIWYNSCNIPVFMYI